MVKVQFKNLQKAAKKVARQMRDHMKKDGWDLSYSFYVNEVFYQAFGHHLENYLLDALRRQRKRKPAIYMGFSRNSKEVVFTKRKK